ncbi:MAG TPA: hypothetical protein VK021_12250 [Flavobacteriaceae bacterium]|nr:hypothetical protein [Flavobacteriaceae bacterium]
MKNQLLVFLLLFLSFNSYAQITFEAGYFIDWDNQKTNCLIKNLDWKNNPTEFEYKLTENSEPQKATIENVKEFGIDDISKYVGRNVLIDKTYNDEIKRLTEESRPVFQEDEVFLKVLVEGKANLYAYVEGRLQKYFYSVNDSQAEQLIFKKNLDKNSNIRTNNAYKQQLFNDLKCSTISDKRIERLQYKRKDLINFFCSI